MYEVVQVLPQPDFSVYVYFSDGIIKKYDVTPLLDKGVFKQLADPVIFNDRCTVMNNTLAWDISGVFDPYTCLDIAPETIYEKSITVPDPLESNNK